ncbi:MAG: TetR/AcrR family transcriptional regulator, partial [Lachnospiraceae bacterium]|nr:TetR/AcrR family transcriptional regulator [Lachnospiraceae bacterium]
PKAKFTKDEILDMAFYITKEYGIDAVTARELGARLGSSARPIFTIFESMDEVKESVIIKSKELYGQYVEEGLKSQLAFKGVGIAYIRFAIEQPKLFQLLFMRPTQEPTDVSMILPVIDDNYEKILQSVQEPYCLERKAAERLYQHLWTYTHGIATMFATGLCSYTMEQLEERLTDVFKGLLLVEKGRDRNDKN